MWPDMRAKVSWENCKWRMQDALDSGSVEYGQDKKSVEKRYLLGVATSKGEDGGGVS